jgi:hypothetical protein
MGRPSCTGDVTPEGSLQFSWYAPATATFGHEEGLRCVPVPAPQLSTLYLLVTRRRHRGWMHASMPQSARLATEL